MFSRRTILYSTREKALVPMHAPCNASLGPRSHLEPRVFLDVGYGGAF